MKKILVLENVDQIDDNLRAYLKEYHSNDTIEIITNLKYRKTDIKRELSICDELILASSFYDFEQFAEFVTILPNFKNITDIKILYLYTNENLEFINFLNTIKTSHNDVFLNLIKLIESKNVHEIFCKQYELESKTFWRKYRYSFDVVKLYFNSLHHIIYLTRQPKFAWLNDFLFTDETTQIKQKSLKTTVKCTMSKDDKTEFNKMLDEIKSVFDYQYTLNEENNNIDNCEQIKIWQQLIKKYL